MKRSVLKITLDGDESFAVGEKCSHEGRTVESITPKTFNVYYGNGSRKATEKYVIRLEGNILISVPYKSVRYTVLSEPILEAAPTAEEIAASAEME